MTIRVGGGAGSGTSSAIFTVANPSGDTTGATDTAAIQAQIDAAATAGGGIVQLAPAPPATPYYTTQLKLKTNVELVGVSRFGTVLRAPAGNNVDMIVLNSALGEYGWAIRRLTLFGANGAGPAYGGTFGAQANNFGGVTLTGSTQHFAPFNQDMTGTMEDVTVTQMRGHGVNMFNAVSECRFINVYVTSCSMHGFTTSGSDCFFESCTAGGNGAVGFYIAGAVNQLDDCKSWWNGGGTGLAGFQGNYAVRARGNVLINCFSQDSYGPAFHLDGAQECQIIGSSAGCGSSNTANLNAHLVVTNNVGTVADCDVVITVNTQINLTVPGYLLSMRAAASGNRFEIRSKAGANAYSTAALNPTASTAGNKVMLAKEEGNQAVAYAATITPDPYAGGRVIVGALTGAITINNPTVACHYDAEMEFVLTQDSTGGRVVTWGANYKTSAAIPTTASTTTIIRFWYDGTNWHEKVRATA